MFIGWTLDNQAAGDSWNHDAQPCWGSVTREGTLSLGRESRSSESSALTIWKLGVSSSSLVITDNVWNIRRQKWWTKGSFVQDIPQNGQHHQWLSPAGPNGYPIPDIFFIPDPNQFSFENHQVSGNLNPPATQFFFDNRPKPARYWKEKNLPVGPWLPGLSR